jgi:4'-phosphopantetheinyl transferase
MTHLASDIWRTPPATLLLDWDAVHVWRIHPLARPVPANPAEWHLSPAERERGARFHFEQDRKRFVGGREALRLILSRYLESPPADIEFGFRAHGKPYLEPEPGCRSLSFNLSHSGDFVLIAVANNREVGVDVEKIRPEIDLERIARRFFSPGEVESLTSLAEALRPTAFFRCWTRKEAYVKARGGGLAIPTNQFDVTLLPGAPAALLETRGDPEEAARWSLHNVELCEGYQAALAVEGTPAQICFWGFEPENLPSIEFES